MNLRQKSVLIIFNLVLCSCATQIKTVKKADFQIDKYRKVAVMPFQGKPAKAGIALAEYFITEVMDIGFNVIERSQLEKILKEQNISLSGVIDTETIHKVGKIMGVDALVIGSFHCRREKREVTVVRRRPGPIRRMHRRRIPVPRRAPLIAKIDLDPEIIFSEISVRFVDVETGEVIISSVSKTEYTAENIRDGLSEIATSIKKKITE